MPLSAAVLLVSPPTFAGKVRPTVTATWLSDSALVNDCNASVRSDIEKAEAFRPQVF